MILRTFTLGDLVYQVGTGAPTHVASLGTRYLDKDTQLLYRNKSGVAVWELSDNLIDTILDQTAVIVDTIAEVEAVGMDRHFIYCKETNKSYRYVTAFDEVVDGVNVLNTVDGGLTRFLGSEYYTLLFQFDTDADIPTYREGRMFWDKTNYCVTYYNENSEVALCLGREIMVRAFNNTGFDIENGDAVTISGAVSGWPTVVLADASAYDANKVTGLATTPIPNGGYGYVVHFGEVHGLNTAAFAVGSELFVDPLNNGKWTTTRPVDGNFPIRLGVVLVSDGLLGSILVDPDASHYAAEVSIITGHPTDNNVTFSFDDTTRVATIVPVTGTEYRFYQQGIQFRKEVDTVTIPDIEGLYLIWYESDVLTTALISSLDIVNIVMTRTLVAYIYWDAEKSTAIYHGNEQHTITMDPSTHAYLHLTRGAQYIPKSGLDITNVVADANGDLDVHAQFGLTGGSTTDEDVRTSSLSTGPTVGLPIYYSYDGKLRQVINAGFSCYTDILAGVGTTGRLVYNDPLDAVNPLKVVSNNDFVLLHVFQVNDIREGFKKVAFIGQAQYVNASTARVASRSEVKNLLLSGFVSPEMVILYTLVLQTGNGYDNAVKARVRSTLDDEGTTVDFIDWRSVGGIASGAVTSNPSFIDNLFEVYNVNDSSKAVGFDVQYVGTGNKRNLIIPDYDVDLRELLLKDNTTLWTPTDPANPIPKVYVDERMDARVFNIGTGLDFDTLDDLGVYLASFPTIQNIEIDIQSDYDPSFSLSNRQRVLLRDNGFAAIAIAALDFTNIATLSITMTGTTDVAGGIDINTNIIVDLNLSISNTAIDSIVTSGVAYGTVSMVGTASIGSLGVIASTIEAASVTLISTLNVSNGKIYISGTTTPTVSNITATGLYTIAVDSGVATPIGYEKTFTVSDGTNYGVYYKGVNKIATIDDIVPIGSVGAANGVAPLDAASKVPYTNLPTNLSRWLGYYATVATLPATGVNGDFAIVGELDSFVLWSSTETAFVPLTAGAVPAGDTNSIQINNAGELGSSAALIWSFATNQLIVGNPISSTGTMVIKSLDVNTPILEVMNTIEVPVFNVYNNGVVRIYETSETITDDGSLWSDMNSDYLKFIKDSQTYALNIDTFVASLDVNITNPSTGDIPTFDAPSAKWVKTPTVDDDRLITRYAFDIFEDRQLDFDIPAGYKILSIIGIETAGLDAGNLTLGSTSGAQDICNNIQGSPNIDKEVQVALAYFSSTQDTEIWARSSYWGNGGVMSLYITFIKVI